MYYAHFSQTTSLFNCVSIFYTHYTQDIALFKEGESASDAVKLMAEDGDNSLLIVRGLIPRVAYLLKNLCRGE